jgi:hypothetical protein
MWKKFALLICLWTSFCCAKPKYDLAVCMIFRDEARYLKEWIEFHRLVGVEHFYLCSHNSTDNYREVLEPYIKKKIVELKEIAIDSDTSVETFNGIQLGFYNECLVKAREETKWLAVIDSDEFLFPAKKKSLIDVLKKYEEFGGVAVNWQMFGTSHVEKLQPHELITERLTCCAHKRDGANFLIKSIVQPMRVSHFASPHFAIYVAGQRQVNTDKVSFEGPQSPYVQINRLRINHYWSRDEFYFFNYKVARQQQWWGRDAETLKRTNDKYNEKVDLSIQRFVPKLRKKMNLPVQ